MITVIWTTLLVCLNFVVIQGPDGVAGMKGDTGDDGNAVRLCSSLKITHAVALQLWQTFILDSSGSSLSM